MSPLRIIGLFITVAVTSLTHAQVEAYTSFYGVYKSLHYRQTSAAVPLPATGTDAAQVSAFLPDNTSGSLRFPSGTTTAIAANRDINQNFSSRTAMDAAFPDGVYTMTAGAVTGIALTLNSNYPADIPRVTNGTWNARGELMIDPTKDYTITFNSFPEYGANGVVSNFRYDLSTAGTGDADIMHVSGFSSQRPAAPASLTIPAGTLVAGRVYNGEVARANFGTVNTTAISGSLGFTFAELQLNFQIAAVAPANAAPTIATQPASKTIAAGSTVVFSVGADGTPVPAYQWRRGTTNLAGETRSTLVLSGAAASAGNYNCVVTNSGGTVTTADAVLTVNAVAATAVGRLVNLSVLAPTGPGAQLLTMGATVGGQGATGPGSLIIRGIGPTLGTFGVGGVLADPVLSIVPSGGTTASATNDNWGGTPALIAAFAGVGAFALPPASLDSAVLLTPAVGGFTVQVAGKGTARGTVIAEVYDAAGTTRTATTPRLTNLSTLTSIAAADSLAAGFVIGGSTARTVLVRAVGPTLGTAFGIGGAMTDPKLELFNNDTGVKIAENDNWSGAAWLSATGSSVGAFALGGVATKDAALVITLAPGPYSARVSGVNGVDGTAIIEVYEVP